MDTTDSGAKALTDRFHDHVDGLLRQRITAISVVGAFMAMGVATAGHLLGSWSMLEGLTAGAVPGALSGVLQYFNRAYLYWLRHDGWVRPRARQATLLQSYAKDAVVIGGYLLLVHAGLVAMGLQPEAWSSEVASGLASTLALSVYSETVWFVVNADITSAIGSWTGSDELASRLSDGFSVAQSAVVTGIQVACVGGSDQAMGSFGLLGTVGLVFYGAFRAMTLIKTSKSIANLPPAGCSATTASPG